MKQWYALYVFLYSYQEYLGNIACYTEWRRHQIPEVTLISNLFNYYTLSINLHPLHGGNRWTRGASVKMEATDTNWQQNRRVHSSASAQMLVFQFPPSCYFPNLSIVIPHVIYWISRLYWTGLWHTSCINMIKRIYQLLLQDRKFC